MAKIKGTPTPDALGNNALSILLYIIGKTMIGQGTGIRELAKKMNIQTSCVSAHVDRLESRGLVRNGRRHQYRAIVATCTIYVNCDPPEPTNGK